MDERTTEPLDPHAEIVRLETQIERLEATLESCRKFILAARIAMALGGVLLIGLIAGVVRFDLLPASAAIIGLLGGFIASGSNRSTAHEAADELAAARRDRAAMIGLIDLRVVAGRETLH